jgi:membrane-associated phospholipid phosphatase
MITIPFGRYVLGAHGLEQIIFGISLGICSGLIMHFLVRDNIISHIEQIIDF